MRARTGAPVAQDRGVDGDRLRHAGGALGEGQLGAQQGVRAGLHPPTRAARGSAAATEERLEHVAETTEPGPR